MLFVLPKGPNKKLGGNITLKNFGSRLLAMVLIAVMALTCTAAVFAEEGNPYLDSYYDIPSSGVAVCFDTPVLAAPRGEQIGTLEVGTECRVLGRYEERGRVWFIVDLTLFDGFHAEYGFVKVLYIVENPRWIMLTNPTSLYSTTWLNDNNRNNGEVSGLVMILDEDEDFYAVQYSGDFGGTSFLEKYLVQPYSQVGQEMYVLPIGAPVYDSLHNQIGELPGMTVIQMDGPAAGDYLHIKANPGTDDELSCWIVFQSLQKIIS